MCLALIRKHKHSVAEKSKELIPSVSTQRRNQQRERSRGEAGGGVKGKICALSSALRSVPFQSISEKVHLEVGFKGRGKWRYGLQRRREVALS